MLHQGLDITTVRLRSPSRREGVRGGGGVIPSFKSHCLAVRLAAKKREAVMGGRGVGGCEGGVKHHFCATQLKTCHTKA